MGRCRRRSRRSPWARSSRSMVESEARETPSSSSRAQSCAAGRSQNRGSCSTSRSCWRSVGLSAFGGLGRGRVGGSGGVGVAGSGSRVACRAAHRPAWCGPAAPARRRPARSPARPRLGVRALGERFQEGVCFPTISNAARVRASSASRRWLRPRTRSSSTCSEVRRGRRPWAARPASAPASRAPRHSTMGRWTGLRAAATRPWHPAR
jgi:hypothetical protein